MSGDRRGRIHASTVALEDGAVVIRGRPGSGKSDLALRLIDAGGVLVADDQTMVERRGGTVVASAPEAIRGRIEVRGIGIVNIDDAGPTPVALIVDLEPATAIPRMPADEDRAESVLGIDVPRVSIDPEQPGAVARIKAALGYFRAAGHTNTALVSWGEQC